MNDRLLAAVDANLNRSLEGLRVCEDVCRFMLQNGGLSGRIKSVRHDIAAMAGRFDGRELLRQRNVEEDPIKFSDADGEKRRSSAKELFVRNLHRATEALRSLEEFAKLDGVEGPSFQAIRFSLYAIEKDAVSALEKAGLMARFRDALYAICDPSFAGNDLVEAAGRLADGGASIIQLRMKDWPAREMAPVAREMGALCRERGVVFIVNDRPDIALCSGAQGVHLGQDDLPVRDARKVLPPDMIIGVSTHSRSDAERALESAPDYIAVGPVFATSSKYGEPLGGIGTSTAREIAGLSPVPVVAIGGVTPGRVGELARAGVRCHAAMSYLFKGGIETRCAEFMEEIRKSGE